MKTRITMNKSIKRITPVLFLLTLIFASATAQDDFKIIKKRVVNELMKADVNDAEVTNLLVTIREDGTWPGINYEDVSRTGFEHRFHLSNMLVLARAYKNKDSKLYNQKRIKRTIELALKNWVDNDYICDNWWHNQIGTTNSLVTLMLIVGNDLDKDLVEKAQPIIGSAFSTKSLSKSFPAISISVTKLFVVPI
jgi:chondroitin AC lyase